MSFFSKLFKKKSSTSGAAGSGGGNVHDADSSDDDDLQPNQYIHSAPVVQFADVAHTKQDFAPVTIGRRGGCDYSHSDYIARAGSDLRRSHTTRFSERAGPGRRAGVDGASSERPSSDMLDSRFRSVKLMHRGSMANVYRAVDSVHKVPVVLKCYPKNMTPSRREHYDNEVKLLQQLAGVPGIVQLTSCFDTEDHHYLVMEVCSGYTLIELVAARTGRFSERQCALDVVVPVLHALAGLHAAGIAYRNLKPEHLHVDTDSVKLLDFTEALDMHQRCLNFRSGAVPYMAPELLNKPTAEEIFHKVLYHGMAEEELPQYNEKVDIWSLGVVVYEALTGSQPFFADTVPEMQAAQAAAWDRVNADGLPDFITKQGLSLPAQQFLAAALNMDPSKRPSAEKLLQHPWCQIRHHQAVSAAAMRRSVSGPGSVGAPTRSATFL